MNKAQKIFTAIALSTTLAMGAVPAFAADGSASVNKTDSFVETTTNNGAASTTLNVYASASQIQATIPVDITIVTPAKGGTITAPTDAAYKIVNNNQTTPLKVTAVKGVDANEWSLKSSHTPNAAEISGVGELVMTVKAGASSAVPIVTTGEGTKIEGATQSYFTAPANGELGLALAGTSKISSADGLTANSTYPAVKITYTVSAGA